MARQNRKQTVELELEARYGNYEAWTSPTYAEVRGSNGSIVKRFSGARAASEALTKAEDLALVLSHA